MVDHEKRIGVAMDFSSCSFQALKWAVDNLCGGRAGGVHLIIINVQPKSNIHYEGEENQLWEDTGSPLIPLSELSEPNIQKKFGVKLDAETLDMLHTAETQEKIVVVMKVYWGDPREKICQSIVTIPLSCLVIGSRGLGTLRRVVMGSVSNYVVNHADCPVTVVKDLVPIDH